MNNFKWFFSVLRNMIIGIGGILGANFLLAGLGITVGVNLITAAVVGLLGFPGFLLLYATQMLMG